MRKPRLLQKGAKYHVSAKINRGEHLFKPDEIKSMFIETIKRSKKKYKFAIYNFVVMENHIHLFMNIFNIILVNIYDFLQISRDFVLTKRSYN
jgi:putative transposase